MQISGIITFTTDFGSSNPYAGVMKGIVLGANPRARIIDITHEIPAHNILHAAFTLEWTYFHFTPGTIHVAVIDPGVGEGRKNIAVLTENYIFVGPDNGVFTQVLAKEPPREIRMIKNSPFVLPQISSTFHGRDVFAPCAGHLSAGKPFEGIGPVVKQIKYLKYPRPVMDKNKLKGEVVSIDSFGNMITNISEQAFREFAGKRKLEIYFGAEIFTRIVRHYNDVKKGLPLVLFGSSRYMEISMNEGNAAEYFMSSVGSPVTIRRF